MVRGNEAVRCSATDKTIVCMKAIGQETIGKPDAGNPPVRFDEGGGLLHLYSIEKDLWVIGCV
jgi:hypothetical protein